MKFDKLADTSLSVATGHASHRTSGLLSITRSRHVCYCGNDILDSCGCDVFNKGEHNIKSKLNLLFFVLHPYCDYCGSLSKYMALGMCGRGTKFGAAFQFVTVIMGMCSFTMLLVTIPS